MIGLLCSAFALLRIIIPLGLATDTHIPRGVMDAPVWALVHARQ